MLFFCWIDAWKGMERCADLKFPISQSPIPSQAHQGSHDVSDLQKTLEELEAVEIWRFESWFMELGVLQIQWYTYII